MNHNKLFSLVLLNKDDVLKSEIIFEIVKSNILEDILCLRLNNRKYILSIVSK